MLCPQNNFFFFLYIRKNVTRLNACLFMIGQIYSFFWKKKENCISVVDDKLPFHERYAHEDMHDLTHIEPKKYGHTLT
jgi:hypothetical protein